MKTRLIILAALLALPSAALAQNYVIQSAPMPYVPLSGSTALTFSSSDDSSVTIPIGFSFPYFGNNFTQVLVNTNGFVSFTTGVCTSGCNSATAIPSTSRTPHNIIAPWWDDNQMNVSPNTSSSISYVSTPTQLDIEWRNLNAYSFSGFVYQITMKLTLLSTGAFQVHYGSFTGSGGTAAAGFEDSTGAMGASFPLPPMPNSTCSTTATNCSLANWPTDTLYTVGQPVNPDLVVQSVQINSVTNTAGMLSLSVTPTFRNFGQNATTTGFRWRAFLSTDRIYQAGTDLPIITNSNTNLNVAGGATVSDTATGSRATPPAGNYYVLIEVDWQNTVDEGGALGEGNNIGSSTNYFTSGVDLVATSVSGPTMSGPGNMMSVAVNWFNQGSDAAGTVEFTIYLSTDAVYSAGDFPMYTSTRNIAGGQTVMENVMFTVPNNVPGGDFFYILRVNTAGTPVTEATATNNAVASTGKVTVRQADLVIKAVEFVDPLTGLPTRTGLFGSPGRMLVTAANEGGADARNFKVGVVISTDTNLSLLQDTLVIEFDVAQVLQGTTQVIDVPFNVPLNDRAMRAFTTGNYYWFALLDSQSNVTELNEFNNNMVLGPMGMPTPVLMSSPAADLTVTRFDAPSTVGVGELAPVYRVFKNIGNRPASDVKYRYYLSANSDVTSDDTVVKIVNGGTSTDFGSIGTMNAPPDATSVQVATEMVEIPSNIQPGTYWLGAVLDPDGAVPELSETNNGLGSLPITVAASALRVTTPSLPDAVIGRPYSFQLSVAGDVQGQPTSWMIDTTQGALPMGMMLSTTGLLTGTPTAEAVVGVTFVVSNNGRTALARLALRVLPTTTQVEITTPSLPAVVNSTAIVYETYLGAAGGVKPYAWSIVPVAGEALPRNITLTRDGRLAGTPASGIMEKSYPITLEVRDSLGTASRRQFNLRVVAPGAIIFTNLSIPDGLVGVTYLTDIAVKNFDMSPLAKPLTYKIVAGGLPDGITMGTESDTLLLQGTPLVAGTFAFTIEVEDAKGRNDSADFLLRVYPPGLKITANDIPPQLRPGDPVDFTFSVTGSMSVTYAIFSGSLPPGATLGSDGHVTGTVATENAEGTFNFVVEARDANGASGIGAFSMQVKREPPKQGCTAAPVGALAWAAALLLLSRRRQNRAVGS